MMTDFLPDDAFIPADRSTEQILPQQHDDHTDDDVEQCFEEGVKKLTEAEHFKVKQYKMVNRGQEKQVGDKPLQSERLRR